VCAAVIGAHTFAGTDVPTDHAFTLTFFTIAAVALAAIPITILTTSRRRSAAAPRTTDG
jgi:hypothetical protein